MPININTGLFDHSMEDVADYPTVGGQMLGTFFYFSNTTQSNVSFYDFTNPTSSSFEWFTSNSTTGKLAIAKKPPTPLLIPNKTTSIVVVDNGAGDTKFTLSFHFENAEYNLQLNLNNYAKLSKNGQPIREHTGSLFIADIDSTHHLRVIWGFDLVIIQLSKVNEYYDAGIDL